MTIGEREFRTRVDRSGLLDLTITDHGLKPGWHDLSISSPRAADTTAAVFIVAPDQTFGIVSDIDDTIITTTMPRPMIAAWNTFFRHEGTRRAVPGMATMYRELLAAHPTAAQDPDRQLLRESVAGTAVPDDLELVAAGVEVDGAQSSRDGVSIRADDRGDPVVQLAPPLTVGQAEFDDIEQRLRSVLTAASARL